MKVGRERGTKVGRGVIERERDIYIYGNFRYIYIYIWQRPRQMGQFNSILAIFPSFIAFFVGPIWAEELISAEIGVFSVRKGSKLQKYAFLVHTEFHTS